MICENVQRYWQYKSGDTWVLVRKNRTKDMIFSAHFIKYTSVVVDKGAILPNGLIWPYGAYHISIRQLVSYRVESLA